MADANIRAVITAEDKASATLAGFSKNLGNVGAAALDLVKHIAQIGTVAASAITVLGVKTAADLESARQGFITLLGSAEAADHTLKRIKEEAARTPFEMVGLTQATQLLASVTKNGDRALNFILDIGEGLAAMGRGQAELDRISVNLQQIAATGHAASIDIKQFAFAGIPIYEMLQKQIGLSGEALAKFIEDGGVTFDLLEKMFDKATQQGGQFFGAYKNQLGTFNQQWSNLKDTFATTAADLVVQSGLFDALKNAMQAVGDWVSGNKESIISFFKNASEVGKVLLGAFTQIAGVVRSFLVAAFNVLSKVAAFLRSSFDALVSTVGKDLVPTLTRLWKEVIQPLLPVLGVVLVAAIWLTINALNILIKTFSFVVNAGLNIANFFSKTLPEAQTKAIQAVVGFFVTTWNNVTNTFKQVFQSVVGFFQEKINALVFVWQNLPLVIGFHLGVLAKALSDFFTITVPNFINGVVDWFNQLPGRIGTALLNMATTVANWFTQTKDSAVTKSNDLYNGVVDWFVRLPGRVSEIVSGLWNSVSGGFNSFKDNAIKWAENTVNGIVDWFKKLPGQITDSISKGAQSFAGGFVMGFQPPHKALGGPVSSGAPYLVGEQGPELFVPSGNGTIVPNNKMSGGGASVINITVQAGAFMGNPSDARAYARMIMEHMKDIAGTKNMTAAEMLS